MHLCQLGPVFVALAKGDTKGQLVCLPSLEEATAMIPQLSAVTAVNAESERGPHLTVSAPAAGVR
jgi:hypothetical protein